MEVAKVMTRSNSHKAQAISKFLNDSLKKFQSGSNAPEAHHIDELGLTIPASVEDQISLAFDLFRELVGQYQVYSADLMVILVFVIQDAEAVKQHQWSELLEQKLLFSESPILYVSKRPNSQSPYIVEEHKVPLTERVVSLDEGYVYGYFRSHRNDPKEPYNQGFYFEHYLVRGADNPWEA